MTLRVHPDEIVGSSRGPLLGKHESWERVRLGAVADVLNGFAFKSAHFGHEGGVPLLRIRDVGSSTTQIRYTGDYDPRYMVNSGTIVVGMDGDFRAARWTGPPALLNQRVCTITVREEGLYDSTFLLHALPSYLAAIHDWTSSITVKHLSSETVKEIPLPLPPLAEQRRIVAVIDAHSSRLDAAEQSLEQAKRRVALLRTSARSQAVLGEWPVVALGQVTESQIYGSSAKPDRGPHGVPILRMGNIRDGALNLDELKYLPVDHPDIEKCRLQPGDLLFNRTNSPELVGKSAVFRTGPDPTVFASYLIRVRLCPECDPDWAALVINSHLGRRYVASVRTQQVGQANVNGTKLAAMPIPLPPLGEQRRILREVEQQLSVLDSTDAQIERALRRSDGLRRSILERAFTGRLVRQDPSEEPASELLERITIQSAAVRTRMRKTKEKTPA